MQLKSEVSAGNLGIMVTIGIAVISTLWAGSGRLATQDAEISTIKVEIAQGRNEDHEFRTKFDDRLTHVDDKLGTIIDRLARIETMQSNVKRSSLEPYK